MIKSQQGFILIVVLIFLFVITLLAVSSSAHIIMDYKMQTQMQRKLVLFLRAEAGMQQVVLSEMGQTIVLPDSPISLKTSQKNINTDACGNTTVEIQSIAQSGNNHVMLNSEDIFAKVPSAPGCMTVPKHQCVWYIEL